MRGNSLSRQQIHNELRSLLDVNFNHFLKLLREAFITRAEWLKVVGMSRTAVESYEMKDRLPDIDYIVKLSALTGYDLTDLIKRRVLAGGATEMTMGWVHQSLPSQSTNESERYNPHNLREIENKNSLLIMSGNKYVEKSYCNYREFTGSLKDGLYAFKRLNGISVKQVEERLNSDIVISDKDSAELYRQEDVSDLPILGEVTELHFQLRCK